MHLDVYLGKNAKNIRIYPSLQDLPTTQKAVINASFARQLHNEMDGMRHVSMDNHYMCPEVGVIL